MSEQSHLIRFLSKNRYLVGSRESPDQELTHTLMDGQRGGKVALPSSAVDDFFAAYGRDLAAGVRLFVIERRSTVFKLHFDLDIDTTIGDAGLQELVDVIYAAVALYFPSLSNFVCIACASMRGSQRISSSLHLVFPTLPVTEEQALWIRAGVVARCNEMLGHLGLNFGKVVDICVLTTSGLRMVGSDKCRQCPICKNAADARPFCDRCSRQGRVVEDKVYMPWRVWPLANAESASLERNLTANLAYAAKMCSIRLLENTETSPAFSVPPGAPPANTRKRQLSGSVLTDSQAQLPPGFSKLMTVDLEPALRARLGEELRAFNPAYARIDMKDVRMSKHRRGLTFIIKVSGFGCRFCLNKGGDHTSQCIYFVATAEGLQQRCYSRKMTTYSQGLCEAFSSAPRPLPDDILRSLFEGEAVVPPTPKRPDLNFDYAKPPELPDDETLLVAVTARRRGVPSRLSM